MDKAALREQMRQRKRAMTAEEIEEKSRILCQMLVQTEEYRRAQTIYGYLPFNQEVRTLPILEQALRDGKKVALPKILDKQMHFAYITDFSQAQRGYGGTPEPADGAPVAQDRTALVLVPGLAFDQRGFRIGYGGGFYDRFLAQEPEHPAIALCYDFQMLPKLETEEFDVPVDRVLWA